jgi:hypothetical protein
MVEEENYEDLCVVALRVSKRDILYFTWCSIDFHYSVVQCNTKCRH